MLPPGWKNILNSERCGCNTIVSYHCQWVGGWVSDSFRCDAIASPSFASLFSIQLKMLSRSLPSAPTHHCMVTSIFQGRQTPLECSFLSFNKIYYLLCSFLLIITYKSPRNSNAAKLRFTWVLKAPKPQQKSKETALGDPSGLFS